MKMSDDTFKDLCAHAQTTLFSLILLCTFSIINLGVNDEQSIASNSAAQIPIISISISYIGFMIFTPMLILCLLFYLHAITKKLLLSKAGHQSAFLVLIQDPMFSYLLYLTVPALIFLFALKAAPRREGPLLTAITIFTFGATLHLLFYRRPAERTTFGHIWRCTVCSIIYLFSAFILYKYVSSSVPTWIEMHRHVNLYGADLNNKDMSNLFLGGADLRFAKLSGATLQEGDLNGTDLRHADLSKAILIGADLRNSDLRDTNLTEANLKRAKLQKARIDNDTKLGTKWKLVYDLVNNQDFRAFSEYCDHTPLHEMTWTDLSGADLSGANLVGYDITGIDLRGADLSRSEITKSRTVLPFTDDETKLPANVNFLQPLTDRDTNQNVINNSDILRSLDTYFQNQCMCIDVDPGRLQDDRGDLVLHKCPLPKWKVTKEGDYIKLRTESSGKVFCLDRNEDTKPPHVWTCLDNHPNQKWKFIHDSGGRTKLQSFRGECLYFDDKQNASRRLCQDDNQADRLRVD